MKPIKLLQEHCEFISDYDCYVLLAVSRKKDTPEITNSQEIVFREVIKNEKDIIRKYNKIKAQVTNYVDEKGKIYPFYIYISLNARNSLKAVFNLRAKIDDWLRQTIDGVDCSKMFKKTYGHFYSELMRKEAKSKHTKYFMIDCDTKEKNQIKKVEIEINKFSKILLKQETKNGYHYKIIPYDIGTGSGFSFTEIKKDANFFVEYIPNK